MTWRDVSGQEGEKAALAILPGQLGVVGLPIYQAVKEGAPMAGSMDECVPSLLMK